MKYLIIGCSAAGVNAAAAIRQRDPSGEMLLLTREEDGHYSRPLLSYYLAQKVDEERVFYRGRHYLEQLRATVLHEREVVRVCCGFVVCTDGSSIPFDRLLIASGGVARQPAVPGIELPGVFHFRTLADARAVSDWVPHTRCCVSMGGGLVSLKVAEALRRRGVAEVRFIIGSDRVMSQALDRTGAALLEKRLAAHGVFTQTGDSVVEILGAVRDHAPEGCVSGVRIRVGGELSCEMVIVGKGVRPNLPMLGSDCGIATDWGILVDERMQTNVPGIFAAGDVAQALDLIHAENYVNALWPLAAQQGWVAGVNMAGGETTYPGWFGMNSLQVFGLPVITMGLVTVESDTDELRVVSHVDERREIYRKLVVKEGRLVGAAAIGDTDATQLAALIRSRQEVGPWLEELLLGRVTQGRGFSPMSVIPVDLDVGDAIRTAMWETTPRGLAHIVIHPERCLSCGSCELACTLAHSGVESLQEALALPQLPLSRIRLQRFPAGPTASESSLPEQQLRETAGATVGYAQQDSRWLVAPLSCRHCEDASCVWACIAGVRNRTQTGVDTDEAACVGCGSCYMVCPTGAIRRDVPTGRYASCDRCGDGNPRCVAACPTKALEIVDGEGDVYYDFVQP